MNDHPPAPAPRPAVPRFERVAAALLIAAYVPLWVLLFIEGNTPWQIFRDVGGDLYRLAVRLVSTSGQLGRDSADIGLVGMILGLITASAVLLGHAVLRLAGRQGFLRERSFWAWVCGHGAAGLLVYGLLFSALRVPYSSGMRASDYLFLAGFTFPLCIGCVVLRRTRVRR